MGGQLKRDRLMAMRYLSNRLHLPVVHLRPPPPTPSRSLPNCTTSAMTSRFPHPFPLIRTRVLWPVLISRKTVPQDLPQDLSAIDTPTRPLAQKFVVPAPSRPLPFPTVTACRICRRRRRHRLRPTVVSAVHAHASYPRRRSATRKSPASRPAASLRAASHPAASRCSRSPPS